MQRISRCLALLVLPVLAVTISAAGCGDKKEDKPRAADGGKKADDKGSQPAPAGAPEAIVGKGVAVLKGKISYDGDAPAPGDLTARMKEHKDGEHCLKGPTKDPNWTVAADKGVKNVVVWVKAPKGKYFQLSDDQKKPADNQPKVDQPHCLFEPHVTVLYPSYFDGSKQVATGQKFKVLNSAPMVHNTTWKGTELVNNGKNETIKAGGELELPIIPATEVRTGEDLVKLNCDLHKWMEGYVWAFDHPFAAVTKEDGTFEIKGIPAGAEVEITYWHESMGRQRKTEKKSLKDGDNDFSMKIK